MKTKEPSLLVTEVSATTLGLGYPTQQYNIGLDADHSELVKYASRHNGDYIIVKDRLAEVMASVKEKEKEFQRALSQSMCTID